MPSHDVPPADRILHNGAIYTVDGACPWARAVALRDGAITYVGDDAGVRGHAGPHTETIDLNGKMVLPGFHDCHVHLYEGGLQMRGCDLWDSATAEDALDRLRRHVAALGPGVDDWIFGSGLQKSCADDMTSRVLDEIAPRNPLYIMTFDGHSCWVNTRALTLAGIDENTADPPQGRIERLAGSRRPSGYLYDFAAQMVRDAIPTPSLETRVAGLTNGIAAAHRYGITSIIEPGLDAAMLAPYQELSGRGKLPLRVRAAISPINWQPGAFGDDIFDFVAARNRLRRPDIDVESVKIYIDGVLENGSAVLLAPYADERFGPAAPFYSQADLDRYVTWIDAQNLQVHLHAIGDGGVRMALDAFETARRANGPRDNRHHICHVQMINPADVPRFAELDVTATFQPMWAYPDPYVTDSGRAAVSDERVDTFYLIGSVQRHGGRIACGSDWFVSSLNPLDAITVGILRQDPHLPEGSPVLNPSESVDLATLIAGYTINGAYVMHQEARTGSIEVGKRADLVVLERNLFELPAARIKDVEVVMTIFDGRPVYVRDAIG